TDRSHFRLHPCKASRNAQYPRCLQRPLAARQVIQGTQRNRRRYDRRRSAVPEIGWNFDHHGTKVSGGGGVHIRGHVHGIAWTSTYAYSIYILSLSSLSFYLVHVREK